MELKNVINTLPNNVTTKIIPFTPEKQKVCRQWRDVLKSKKDNYINSVIKYIKLEQDNSGETILINSYGEDIDTITIEIKSLDCAIICINSPYKIIEKYDGSYQLQKLDQISIDLKNQCELIASDIVDSVNIESLTIIEKKLLINSFFERIYENFNSFFQLENPFCCNFDEKNNPKPSRIIGGFIRMKNPETGSSFGFDDVAINNLIKFFEYGILYPLGPNIEYPGTRERKFYLFRHYMAKEKKNTKGIINKLTRFGKWAGSLFKNNSIGFDPLGLIRKQLGEKPTWNSTIIQELDNQKNKQGIYSIIDEFWDGEKNKPKIEKKELIELIDNILNDELLDIDSIDFINRLDNDLKDRGFFLIPDLMVTLRGWYKYLLINDINSICDKFDLVDNSDNSNINNNRKEVNFSTPKLKFQNLSSPPPQLNKRLFVSNKIKRNSKKAYNERRKRNSIKKGIWNNFKKSAKNTKKK